MDGEWWVVGLDRRRSEEEEKRYECPLQNMDRRRKFHGTAQQIMLPFSTVCQAQVVATAKCHELMMEWI